MVTSTVDHVKPITPRPDPNSARPPSSDLGKFLWRRKMWFESTFVISMLEPWEKVIVLTLFMVIFILVLTGLFKYLPYLVNTQRRAVYYLWGQEGDERPFWQWLGVGPSLIAGDSGLHKEL